MGIKTSDLIINSQKYYKQLKPIYCPVLKATIHFNRHGWNHFIYDSRDHRRTELELRLRLHLLPYIAETVTKTTNKPLIETRLVKLSKKELKVKYYELSSHYHGKQYIKVIIRKFPQGEYHYFSVRRKHTNKKPT